MARKLEVEKAKIILESFIRNKGHYRKNCIDNISTFLFLICHKSRKPKRAL